MAKTGDSSPAEPEDPTASRVDLTIGGECDPGFAAVEAAFRENFVSRQEIGGAVSFRVNGRLVVDRWGGHRDAARTTSWERDTLVNACSA